MARHNIDDIIQVIDLEHRAAGPTFRAIITEILSDDEEDGSEYEVMEVDDEGMFWEVGDNMIMTMQEVAEAMATTEAATHRQEVTAALQRDWENQLLWGTRPVGNHTVELVGEVDNAIGTAIPAEHVDFLRADPTESYAHWVTRRAAERQQANIVAPVEVQQVAPPTDIVELDANGHILVTTELGHRFTFDNTQQYNAWQSLRVPVAPAQDADQNIRERGREMVLAVRDGLSKTDYTPRVGGTRPLKTYTIDLENGTELIHLTPEIAPGGERYEFFDQYGEEWESEHGNWTGLRSALNTPRDHVGQRWVRTRDMTQDRVGERTNLAKKIPKKKKHLRRRTPMPEIKEAKHYGSKDFIG